MPSIKNFVFDPKWLSVEGYGAVNSNATVSHLRQYGDLEDNCAMLLSMMRATGLELPDKPTSEYENADWINIAAWGRRYVKPQHRQAVVMLIQQPKLLRALNPRGVPELKDMLNL